jgi:Protein of unknown function (DUF3306)
VAAVAEKSHGKSAGNADGKADGFLGRWARRKNDALQGKPLDEPALAVPPAPVPVTAANAAMVSREPPASDAAPEPVRELSLDDAKLLTQDSDFKPFMAINVGPEVRNAAMKKLFADPHFNVMDGLDIYVDDYSISEPIPEAMLRQMTSAKFLKIFDDEEDDEQEKAAAKSADNPDVGDAASRESANGPGIETVAHSEDVPSFIPSPVDSVSSLPASLNSSQPELLADSGASHHDHDHTDLRLQPDDAAPGTKAGGRT